MKPLTSKQRQALPITHPQAYALGKWVFSLGLPIKKNPYFKHYQSAHTAFRDGYVRALIDQNDAT